MNTPLGGHLCLSVTPFASDGSLDLASLRRLVTHLFDGGVDGVIVLGSTGEFFSLTDVEREEVIRTAVTEASGRGPVIAGVGASGTGQAVALAQRAVAAGADAVMVPPAFYAPAFFSSAESIEAHLVAVARASWPAQVMLYDGGGGVEIPIEVIGRVCRATPNISAVKLTVPSPAKTAAIRDATNGQVKVLCGNDALTLYELALGVDGVAIGVGNVVPREVTAVVRGYREGRRDEARSRFYDRVLPVVSIALCATQQFVQVFKLGLARMGVIASDRVREPLLPLDDPRAEEALGAFRHVGLSL